MADNHRPVPIPDEQSAGYWAAAARHELRLATCSHCGWLSMPPDAVCPNCLSTDPRFTFEPVSGRGKVRSWVVAHDSFLPGFEDDLPLVLVDVELEDQAGLRMIGRLVDGPLADVRVGDRTSVVFEDVAPGVAVPAFTLASDGDGA